MLKHAILGLQCGLLAVSVSGAAFASERILENFGSPSGSYVAEIRPTEDSGTGVVSWEKDGFRSVGALRIECDPKNDRSFCLWRYPAASFDGKETYIAFRAKGRPGDSVVVRLLDSTGQVFQ